MTEQVLFQSEILTNISNQIEKECGFKNGGIIAAFILLCMDEKTWTFDKSYLAKFYQAIDIIEKSEELKKLFNN